MVSFLQLFCLSCTPVSYTQLDVYKRQLLYRTGVTGMDALNGFMMQYQPGSADPLTIEIQQEEMSSLLAHFSQEVYDARCV